MLNHPDDEERSDIVFAPPQDALLLSHLLPLRSTSWLCDLRVRLFLLPVWERWRTISSHTGCTCFEGVVLSINWPTCKNFFFTSTYKNGTMDLNHGSCFRDAKQLPCFNALEQGTIVNLLEEEMERIINRHTVPPSACKNNWLAWLYTPLSPPPSSSSAALFGSVWSRNVEGRPPGSTLPRRSSTAEVIMFLFGFHKMSRCCFPPLFGSLWNRGNESCSDTHRENTHAADENVTLYLDFYRFSLSKLSVSSW